MALQRFLPLRFIFFYSIFFCFCCVFIVFNAVFGLCFILFYVRAFSLIWTLFFPPRSFWPQCRRVPFIIPRFFLPFVCDLNP